MKKLLGILVLVCLIFGISACEKTPIEEDPTKLETLTLISAGKSDYEIVYAQGASNADSNAVMSIFRLFRDEMGVDLPMTDDYLAKGETHDEETHKIIVGKTNYALSTDAYEGLMYHGFRIITKGTNIAIAAYSELGYTKALNWLKENVFDQYADNMLVTEVVDIHDQNTDAYPIRGWTISDNEIQKYQIIYGDEKYKEAAELLRDDIAEKVGWYLKIGFDTKLEESEYEILIGETSRAASKRVPAPSSLKYTFEVVDGKLVIKTGGAHTTKLLFKKALEHVAGDAVRIDMAEAFVFYGDYFDDRLDSSFADGADLRVMSANVLANLWTDSSGVNDFDFERRAEIFFAQIEYYQPTVVGLQEFCPSWYKAFDTYQFTESWEILKFKNPNIANEYVFSTIMYRSDLYTLIDSGMIYYSESNNKQCRCITWAILEDDSGKRFCMISTHWDGLITDFNVIPPSTLTQLNELAAFVNKQSVPVIIAGDLNANEWTQALKKFLNDTDSYDCMHADESVRVNIADSSHGWGTSDTSVAGSSDHIISQKANSEVLKFQTINRNQQIWVSDHAFIYADIKFK